MPYKVIKLYANGRVEENIQTKAPKYEEIRSFVGGLIQQVPHLAKYNELTRGQMFVNEEGLLHGLSLNDKATGCWLGNLGKGPFSYPPRLYGNAIYWAKVK